MGLNLLPSFLSHLEKQESRSLEEGGAALGLFLSRPPNASRLLLLSFGAWPLPPAYSIASYTLAASKVGTGGGEKGGEGREWGGRVKEGEEDRKTSRSGHDVTSGLFGRGETGTSLAPAPREPSGGGVTGRRRSPVDVFMADHLTPQFRSLALTARSSFPALGGTHRAS
ncbi:hypothetical protein CapIbe_004816 [Capra ibex]